MGIEISCPCQPAGLSLFTLIKFSGLLVCAQGGLDLLYLTKRYETGKEKVAEMLQQRHSCDSYKLINLAHGDIVAKQAELGKTAFPGLQVSVLKLQVVR